MYYFIIFCSRYLYHIYNTTAGRQITLIMIFIFKIYTDNEAQRLLDSYIKTEIYRKIYWEIVLSQKYIEARKYHKYIETEIYWKIY